MDEPDCRGPDAQSLYVDEVSRISIHTSEQDCSARRRKDSWAQTEEALEYRHDAKGRGFLITMSSPYLSSYVVFREPTRQVPPQQSQEGDWCLQTPVFRHIAVKIWDVPAGSVGWGWWGCMSLFEKEEF